MPKEVPRRYPSIHIARHQNGCRLSRYHWCSSWNLGPHRHPLWRRYLQSQTRSWKRFPAEPSQRYSPCHSGYFITKIFHPNVSEKGEICVNTLKKDWNPTNWSLVNILEVVKCLLIVPFPESALNEQAGKMFMENYDEYFKHAKMITSLYATPKELKTLENNVQGNLFLE